MSLRDFGPWLIPPIALLVAAIPRANLILPDATDAVSIAEPRSQLQSKKRIENENSTSPKPENHTTLDHYDHDARHILANFFNANKFTIEPLPLNVAFKATDPKIHISLNEQFTSSEATKIYGDLDDQSLNKAIAHVDIQFVITTLPDPVYSNLQNDFDTALDAIQSGAADLGYSRDQFWLPWTKLDESPDYTSTDTITSEPGIILFRRKCAEGVCHNGNRLSLLIVFLVGETPTAGIHKLALSSALEQTTEILRIASNDADFQRAVSPGPRRSEKLHQKPTITISLLAPYFTGSSVSLERTLSIHQQWVDDQARRHHFPQVKFTIVSGSAMALDRRSFLNQFKANDVTLKATVRYQPDTAAAFLEYLTTELKVPIDEVAILRESDTGFGQNVAPRSPLEEFMAFLISDMPSFGSEERKQLPTVLKLLILHLTRDANDLHLWLHGSQEAFGNDNNSFQKTDISNEASLYYKQAGTPTAKEVSKLAAKAQGIFKEALESWIQYYQSHQYRYLDVPFPLHISGLRSAQEQENTALASLNLDFRLKSFFPVLTPGVEGKDALPSFSELSRPSADLVMSRLLTMLRRENKRYVGIVATDVQDRIYLAEQIHHNCPDTVVFIFGSNLLYLNRDVASDLRGSLVLTTYPLFAANQDWTVPATGDPRERQFPSEPAEGIYNAFMALLSSSPILLDYGWPFSGPPELTPPVWITVVGKTGFLPVAVLLPPPVGEMQYLFKIDRHDNHQLQSKAIDLGKMRRPWVATGLFWTSTAFCILFSFFSIWPRSLSSHGYAWRFYAPNPPMRRLVSLGLFWVAVFLLYSLIAGMIFIPFFLQCPTCNPPTVFSPASLSWAVFWCVAAFICIIIILVIILINTIGRLLCGACLSVQAVVAGRKQLHSQNSCRARVKTLLHATREAITEVLCFGIIMIVPFDFLYLLLAYFCDLAFKQQPNAYPGMVFAALRFTELNAGVSPFVPLFCAGAAVFVWCLSAVRRTALAEAMACNPLAQKSRTVGGKGFLGLDGTRSLNLEPYESQIRRDLLQGFLRLPFAFLLITFVCTLIVSAMFRFQFNTLEPVWSLLETIFEDFHSAPWMHLQRVLLHSLLAMIHSAEPVYSIEGSAFDNLFAAAFIAACVLTAVNLLRFVTTWRDLRRLLRRVAWHPLSVMCAEIGVLRTGRIGPDNKVSGKLILVPEVSLTAPLKMFSGLDFSVQQAYQVKKLSEQIVNGSRVCHEPSTRETRIIARWTAINDAFTIAKEKETAALIADSRNSLGEAQACKEESLAALASLSASIADVFEPEWRMPTDDTDDNLEEHWARAGGLLLASRILDYSRYVLASLRNLIASSVISIVLILMAVSAYPLPESNALLSIGWMMLLAATVIGIFIFAQINREEVLSLLNGGSPGKIDWSGAFVGHVVLYAVLPVVATLGIQFPATFDTAVRVVGSLLPNGTHG